MSPFPCPEVSARAKQLLVRLDKAQFTASEMHVIGVPGASGQPFWLIDSKRTDWERLCATIVAQAKGDRPTPGKRIWELLSVDARVNMNDHEGVSVIAKPFKRSKDVEELRKEMKEAEAKEGSQGARLRFKLAKAMDQVLRVEDFYDKESFAELDLQGDGKELAGRFDRLTPLEKLLLNRRLFEASFPDCVEKFPFSLEDATLTVHVKRTPQPINLVLTNSNPVRWKIVAEEGAKIKNVLVGGHDLQDVQGTDSPIHYYVYHRFPPDVPDSERTYFGASSPKQDPTKLSPAAKAWVWHFAPPCFHMRI